MVYTRLYWKYRCNGVRSVEHVVVLKKCKEYNKTEKREKKNENKAPLQFDV